MTPAIRMSAIKCCRCDNKATHRCSRCRMAAVYCGADCQRADWARHKPECTAAAMGEPLDTARFLDPRTGAGVYLLAGDRLMSIDWGGVHPFATAVAAGQTARVFLSPPPAGEPWPAASSAPLVLEGPKPVAGVMDALCKVIRNEPLNTTYHADSNDFVPDCARCPRVAFCGFQADTSSDGERVYAALWSMPFCHMGITNSLMMVGPFCAQFTPRAAIDRASRSAGSSSQSMLDYARSTAIREDAAGKRVPPPGEEEKEDHGEEEDYGEDGGAEDGSEHDGADEKHEEDVKGRA